MMAGGVGAAVDHNGIYSNANLHSLQQTEADNPDSRQATAGDSAGGGPAAPSAPTLE
ncbi:hypothetical protein KUCAC02_002865, partial [Chaenocephalus aceratus]